MSLEQRTVLVVGPSWVGDMILSQAFFMALRDRGAEAVDVVTPPGPSALLSRMSEVREAFVLESRHGKLGLGARRDLARHLRARRYPQAYILPSSLKSALLPAMAGIPLRTGHRGELRYGLVNDVRPELPDSFQGSDRNVRGYLALLGSEAATADILPRPRLRVDPENQRRWADRLGLTPDASVVALAPGAAFGPSKRWPADHFQALAKRLAREGRTVLVVGGADERPLGEEIARGAPDACRSLCGRTSLTDAVDLLALADVTVANDSGLAHLAAAAGSPVVALFGPTPPEFSAPLAERTERVYLDLACSPCRKRRCPLGHHRCLRNISVGEVHLRVQRLAAPGSGGHRLSALPHSVG